MVENLLEVAEQALAKETKTVTAMGSIFHTLAEGLRSTLERHADSSKPQTSPPAVAAKAPTPWYSGTTASMALICGQELVLGHVGDSRILLCHGGEAVPLYVAFGLNCMEIFFLALLVTRCLSFSFFFFLAGPGCIDRMIRMRWIGWQQQVAKSLLSACRASMVCCQ